MLWPSIDSAIRQHIYFGIQEMFLSPAQIQSYVQKFAGENGRVAMEMFEFKEP